MDKGALYETSQQSHTHLGRYSSFEFRDAKFKNLNNAYMFSKKHSLSMSLDSIPSLKKVGNNFMSNLLSKPTAYSVFSDSKVAAAALKSMRFTPKAVTSFVTHPRSHTPMTFFTYLNYLKYNKKEKAPNYFNDQSRLSAGLVCREYLEPYAILQAPWEVVEDNHTYRLVTVASQRYAVSTEVDILAIARDDDALYNYLDRGFFVTRVLDAVKSQVVTRTIVTNQLDVDTLYIFCMCLIQPSLGDMTRDGCFVHSSEAQMLRLKMEKKLDKAFKSRFHACKEAIDTDHNSNTSQVVINNLISGVLKKASVNEILLEVSKATYQNISIEAQDLLGVLKASIDFGGDFDVYGLISCYTAHVQDKLNRLKAPETSALKINGIELHATVNAHGVRKINGIRINKNEIHEALNRASCYHDQKDYELFLKRISKMSLRWHDVLSNGLPVKIHGTMDAEDYRRSKPGPNAPAIKFCISPEHKRFALNIAGRYIPVRMSKLIDKVDSINKKTNNGHSRKHYWASPQRNYAWAQKELVHAMIECCTFTKIEKAEDGSEIKTEVCDLQKADVEKILKTANEAKKKALERSKEFLNTAIKTTGATKIEFLGREALKVEGSLRTYAVVIENAKVYDFDTKKYRCIVNDQHYQGAGYDDVAARLYALKNDSVMQRHIGTLQGDAAQPNAENAHNGTLPDRDVEAVDKLTEELLNSLELA